MMKKTIFLFLMVIVTGACTMQRRKIEYKCNAILFLVCDNYPKGYKKTMGELSYTRNVLLVFIIKNLSGEDVVLPISGNKDGDTTLLMRVRGKGTTDVACTLYNKHSPKLSSDDSVAVAIHLQPSDFEKIGIDLDEIAIEDFVQELQFECYYNENGKTTSIITDMDFILSPNIIYKHGKLFVEYCIDGTKKEKEIYEDSNDLEIIKRINISFEMN